MPELKVQLISKSLYVCIPSELLKGDQNRDMPRWTSATETC